MTQPDTLGPINTDNIDYFTITVNEGSEAEVRQDIENSAYEVVESVETEYGIQLKIQNK